LAKRFSPMRIIGFSDSTQLEAVLIGIVLASGRVGWAIPATLEFLEQLQGCMF